MESGEFDEAALWASARGGDPASFGQLFDRHRDRVFGQALRLMRSPHDAEDVTALVFLEAWRKRDAVRLVDGSIVGWLLVTTNYVVRNLVRSLRRYRSAMDRLPAPTAADDHAHEVDARLDRATGDRRVRDAFSRLSKNDQDVITLCVLEELTTGQAAAALGVPVGTVKSRLSRAKARLATLTGPLDPFDPSSTTVGGAR
ncbi:RNA polymerase sigma factor [Herbiconiux sp. P17]|uniref:RNA polymerase sigma factor n=1 Tax=Herbiconiux wuyangfengii TaxID=3342794 RepID=UPI0035B70613